MSPSAALQSRISVFEALQAESNRHQRLKGRVHLPPLSGTPKVLDFDNAQSILEPDPTSPTVDSLCVIPPIQPIPSPSRPSSPIVLGRKSSLIDFSELSSPALQPLSINGTGSTTSSSSTSDPYKKPPLPLRNSPPFPPLPPRKPSTISLKTTAPPPLPKRHASSPVAPSTASTRSDDPSLLLSSTTHTYPPTAPSRGASPGFQSRHVPSSSTSSFHSVSLSSDGGRDTRDSLDSSFEAVSSTAATSPTTHNWEHDLFSTPKPPQRTWQKQTVSSSAMSSTSSTFRRPAPPPPLRRDLKPNTSTRRSLPHHPSASLIPTVRRRYNGVFERNLPRDPRKGRAAGWRGLSVDLLTNGEEPNFGDETPNVPRLDGSIVRQIWSCSRLPRSRLRQIWDQCDTKRLGSLDSDEFAKGMWQIDEELRRGQNHPRPSPLKGVVISYAPRAPPQPLRKPNFLR